MSLEGVMKSAARFILARTGRELKEDKFVTGKWVAGDISNFLAKRARDGDPAALAVYWSMLEREFHIALSELATATDLSLDDEDRIERTWLSAVKRAATASWSAFVETNRSSGGSDLRAFARTAQAVEDLLTSLQRDITKLDTEKEQA